MESVIPLPDELVSFWGALSPAQQRAAQLAVLLNAAADPQTKSRYRRRWWGILEQRVKLCAMTCDTVAGWSSCLSSRLGGTVGRNERHRRAWAELLALRTPTDTETLDVLQQEAPVVIAFVRAYSEALRAAWMDDDPEEATA